MLPKFEYSHLHKFVVSIGVLLVGLAIALPLLVLRDSGPLLVSEATLRTLTPTARRVMEKKQSDARWLADHYLYVSGGLAVSGAVVVIVGLLGWRERQKVEDSRQLYERDTIKATLEQMTPQEVDSKRAVEADEVIADGPQPPNFRSRAETMARVVEVERRLLDLLYPAFYGDVVRSAVKLPSGREVDAVVLSRDMATEYLIEFKYTRNAMSLINRLIDLRAQLLAAVADRLAMPTLAERVHAIAIFVTAEPAKIPERWKNSDVSVVVIPEARLGQVTPGQLRSMIDDAIAESPNGAAVAAT